MLQTRTGGYGLAMVVMAFLCNGCSSGGGGGGSTEQPTLSFGTPSVSSTGGTASTGAVLADVDGDRRADVFVANGVQASVSLLRGQPDGRLATGVPLAAPPNVAAIAVADVTGDRTVDLIAASGTTGDATILVGRGDGTFESPTAIALPWSAGHVAVVDWNGDNLADLIATSGSLSEVAMLPGLGAGAFGTPIIVSTPYVVTGFAVADIDRDLRPDLVTTGTGVGRIDVLRNDGAGGFLPIATTSTTDRGGPLVCCDLNGDRLPDVVSVDADLQSATVFVAAGNSSFSSGITVGLATSPIDSISLGDLDGDGWHDLVAAAGSRVIVSYGDGTGGFIGVEGVWASSMTVGSVVVADMSGSGFLDIACVNGGDEVALLRNPRPVPVGLTGFGIGTPDCRGAIGMWATGPPKVGNADFAYTTTNAPADAAGMFLQGGPANVLGSDPFGNGALLHIGFGLLVNRVIFSDGTGSARLIDPIPADPGLAGLQMHVQTIWLSPAATTCSTSPANLVSSRAMTATIQQ